jgi:hypothetical protein
MSYEFTEGSPPGSPNPISIAGRIPETPPTQQQYNLFLVHIYIAQNKLNQEEYSVTHK